MPPQPSLPIRQLAYFCPDVRAAALAHKDEYGIKQVLDIETADGLCSFKLLDLNNTWWEISTVSQSHYDDAFARGDYRH